MLVNFLTSQDERVRKHQSIKPFQDVLTTREHPERVFYLNSNLLSKKGLKHLKINLFEKCLNL